MILAALLLVLQEAPRVDQPRIDAAVEKGAAYLLAGLRRGPATARHPEQGEFALDELAAYALAHAGIDLTASPAWNDLRERLLTRDLRRTYNVALAALALEALDRAGYQWRISHCAQFLVDNQAANGQWGYGAPVSIPSGLPSGPPREDRRKGSTVTAIKVTRRGKGPAVGDNSNSQYAALGLRACSMAGIQIPDDVIARAAQWWERGQQKDGGWGYGDQGTTVDDSHGSMTAGGLSSLILLRALSKKDPRADAAVRKGFDWVSARYTLSENPGYSKPGLWHYYWLYALERVGVLHGSEQIGGRWWYAEGVDYLLAAQQKDGSWASLIDGKESVGGAFADTCFAILFLRRATKPLPKVESGR